MRVNSSRGLTALCFALCIAGCANLTPPAPDDAFNQAMQGQTLPAAWAARAARTEFQPAWLGFAKSGEVQQLIDEALARNPDLRAAASRLEQSRLQVQIASADLLPNVGFGAGYATEPTPGKSFNANGFGVVLSWEIDLWGRARAEQKGAEALYRSAQDDYAYARQSLAAAVVRAWLASAEAAQQLALARETRAATARQLSLEETRRRVGKASEQDVVLVSTRLASIDETVQQLEQSREAALRGLELLLGRYPSASVATAASLPGSPEPVAAGVPANLLERRPDILAARERFVASYFGAQEAKAARLPRVSLSAGAGRLRKDFFDFINVHKTVFPVGATVAWPLFDGGVLQTTFLIRTEAQQEALAGYSRAILTAMGEVENALAAEKSLSLRAATIGRQVEGYRRSVELTRVQLQVGKADEYEVLQQQLQLYRAQSTQVRLASERLVQRVNLHLALGGDFGTAGAAATSEAAPEPALSRPAAPATAPATAS